MTDRLSQLWKQQVLILNRPGAGGLMAAQAASQADNDGYTLYMTQASTYTVLPIMQQKLPFDLQRTSLPSPDRQAADRGRVTPSLEVNTLPELIAQDQQDARRAAVRRHQSRQPVASHRRIASAALPGSNSTSSTRTGAASTINDVATGRLPIVFEGIAGSRRRAQGKLVKPLASPRHSGCPISPTCRPSPKRFRASSRQAGLLMAPAGMPEAMIQKVNADLKTVLGEPAIIEGFAKIGTYPQYLTPADTAAFIKKETETWWPLVREVGVQR